jgi:hypothetical protein
MNSNNRLADEGAREQKLVKMRQQDDFASAIELTGVR